MIKGMSWILCLILCLLLIIVTDNNRLIFGFSPRDVSISMTTNAVALAHIGKPPPSFYSIPSTTTAEATTTTAAKTTVAKKRDVVTITDESAYDNSKNYKIDVIGKPPNSRIRKDIHISSPIVSNDDELYRQAYESIIEDVQELCSDDEYTTIDTCNPNDLENILLQQHNELDKYISEYTFNTEDTLRENTNSIHDNNNNSYNGDDNDVDDDIPTVPAIFCGYKTSIEEQLRLRSANVFW